MVEEETFSSARNELDGAADVEESDNSATVVESSPSRFMPNEDSSDRTGGSDLEDDWFQAPPSDEGSDSCSSSAESALADLARDNGGARLQSEHGISEVLYRHVRAKMVHMAHSNDSYKTACGRAVGDTYTRYYGDVDRAWPHCLQCFGNL